MSTCGECGSHQIAEPEATPIAERQHCPACGSTARRLERTADDNVLSLRSSLRIKVVRGATGQVAQEQFVGSEQTVADGTWTDKAVVRDYEHDRYAERVVREGDGAELRMRTDWRLRCPRRLLWRARQVLDARMPEIPGIGLKVPVFRTGPSEHERASGPPLGLPPLEEKVE